jgi:hypothetical protein
MVAKVIRGEVLTFVATPTDALGNAVFPSAVNLYVNYVHAAGGASTDPAIPMEASTDGSTWTGQFDTQVALPGAGFASIRALTPNGAADFRFSIVANAANPAPP